MRRLVVGGERVEASSLEQATRVLGKDRLRWEALVPAYGLAEAVLAVTMTGIWEGPRIVGVNREELAAGAVTPSDQENAERPPARIVSAGGPLPQNKLTITDGQVGEIRVDSPSLAVGYLGAPELTTRTFSETGLATGDLGFVLDGELFVTGRLDDLMCVAGRNIYARDIETAASGISGLRAGGCAVVDVEENGETRLVAIVELGQGHPPWRAVAEQVRDRARAATGVAVRECLFVPRGELPKTPSGKIQRFRCRDIAASEPSDTRRRVFV
jgi:acyl-CoA synthetase (AMP-forming)/AMP-acid ligase II